MKISGLLLPLLIAATPSLLQAEEPVTTPPAPASTETKSDKPAPQLAQQLSSVLPKYEPPAPVEAKPATPDPEVLDLPKLTVTQKKRPRLLLTEEVMMKGKSFDEQLARKNSSSLDRNVLNRFTLPAWTGAKSAADRAREEYELKQKQELTKDVLDLAKVTEVVDPAQAKAMRDAINKP